MDQKEFQTLLLSLLEKEVKPSSGCTEVAAIGLSVVTARNNKTYTDFGTFKNAADEYLVGVE